VNPSYFLKREGGITMANNGRLTYDVKETARLLGLSRNSAYQACLKGEIPCLRIGKRVLIPKAKLEQLLLNDGKAKCE
jgi:excisionase family DNA binding protein